MSTDHDQLRDLLERTAPARPELDPGARAAAVARRGRATRLRDRGLVAGAVAAVVAAAVIVPLTLGGDDGPDLATPAPAPTAPPCPGTPVDVGDPAPVPAAALDDVVAVRSCPATWENAQPSRPADPLAGDPANPLTGGPLTGDAAAAYAADLAALPSFGIPAECATMSVYPQPWALVLTTASGDSAVLGSTLRGCGTVRIGGTDRSAQDAVAAFVGNLQRQDAGVPALTCPAGDRDSQLRTPTWNASFEPATAVAGIVCDQRAGWKGGTGAWSTTDLTADDVATVRDDLAANLGSSSGDDTCFDPPSQRLLVLADADGDQVAFLDDGCSGQFAGARGYWTPGPDAASVLSGAAG